MLRLLHEEVTRDRMTPERGRGIESATGRGRGRGIGLETGTGIEDVIQIGHGTGTGEGEIDLETGTGTETITEDATVAETGERTAGERVEVLFGSILLHLVTHAGLHGS